MLLLLVASLWTMKEANSCQMNLDNMNITFLLKIMAAVLTTLFNQNQNERPHKWGLDVVEILS